MADQWQKYTIYAPKSFELRRPVLAATSSLQNRWRVIDDGKTLELDLRAVRGHSHAQVRAVQRQFAFDRLAQILHEMEPVADLVRRGGGPAGGLGVPAVAVPTDRVDVRMRPQPLLDGLRGVIIDHVDLGVPFQVHQDGP